MSEPPSVSVIVSATDTMYCFQGNSNVLHVIGCPILSQSPTAARRWDWALGRRFLSHAHLLRAAKKAGFEVRACNVCIK